MTFLQLMGLACWILELPWLEFELVNRTSGLNRYYDLAEYIDPVWFPKIGDVKIGHALFMKVVSLYHAVHNSPNGHVVFWVDTDVSFREPLPNFVLDWISKRDVVYIPFIKMSPILSGNVPSNGFDYFDLNTSEGQMRALVQNFWRIETGLFSVTVNNKTKVLF